jgi:predicted GIY-YIG superfamily endonuclease
MIPHYLPHFVYILELENGYWYIGIAFNLDYRIKQHIKGKGAKFTRLHKPIRLYSAHKQRNYKEAIDKEKELTQLAIRLFGKEKVCGSGYTLTQHSEQIRQ